MASKKETQSNVNTIHRQLRISLSDSLDWPFLGLGSEEKWYGTYTDEPDGSRDRMTEEMMNDDEFLSIRSSDISCLQCL